MSLIALKDLKGLRKIALGFASLGVFMRGRASLKYQDKPEGEKSYCVQFVRGASANALGGCKVIAGDTKISPQGYCMA